MATTINTYYVDADAEVGGDGTTNGLTGGTCAFKSLSIWEAARDADLTTGDGASNYVVERAICGSAHANHTADTTSTVVSGWTTSANSYIDILTDANNRAGLSWNTGKYRLQVTDAIGLQYAANYLRVDGLQIRVVDLTGYYRPPIYINSIDAANDLRLSNCLLRQAGTSTREPVIYCTDAEANLCVWNTVCYGCGSSTQDNTSGIAVLLATTVNLYNCVFIGGECGILQASGTVTAKNCYAYGARDLAYKGTITMVNCASDDTSADGTDPLDNVAYDTDTFVSVTAGSEDFHLAADGLSPLKGAGVDTSGESAPLNFTTDIEGDTRDATWDIGADAWVEATAAFARLLSDVAGGTFRSIRTTAPFGPIVIA